MILLLTPQLLELNSREITMLLPSNLFWPRTELLNSDITKRLTINCKGTQKKKKDINISMHNIFNNTPSPSPVTGHAFGSETVSRSYDVVAEKLGLLNMETKLFSGFEFTFFNSIAKRFFLAHNFVLGKYDPNVRDESDGAPLDTNTGSYNIGCLFSNDSVTLSGKHASNLTNVQFQWNEGSNLIRITGIVKNSMKNYFEAVAETAIQSTVLGVNATSDSVGFHFTQPFVGGEHLIGAKLMYNFLEETLKESVFLQFPAGNTVVNAFYEKDQLYGTSSKIILETQQNTTTFISAFEIDTDVTGMHTKSSIGYTSSKMAKVKSLITYNHNMTVTDKEAETLFPPIVITTIAEVPLLPQCFVGVSGKIDYTNNIYDFGLKLNYIQ
eukprot:TRINITY_DN2827_c0_g1_i1.p1 TRINITY_DN2827_c0_g1~~TRINITY_DN2827_c0_g1_i1.p1  ORF type:complete len:383 (+),score=84.88 TRINITY_DN2827_c0_g1_i1:3-1151(+)